MTLVLKKKSISFAVKRRADQKDLSDLGAWQVSQLARHPMRPYTLNYIPRIFTEFDELAGDRAFADDKAIVGGPAMLDDQPVMIIGHQKGRDTNEKIKRNFGMPKPEGYRKALRLMKMAERFNMPIITFIDTPERIQVLVLKSAAKVKQSRKIYSKWLSLLFQLCVP